MRIFFKILKRASVRNFAIFAFSPHFSFLFSCQEIIMIFILTLLVAVLGAVLQLVRFFILIAAVKKQESKDFLVLSRIHGMSLFSLFCDMMMPDVFLDLVPCWSTVRISDDIKQNWRKAGFPTFVALVSLFPLKVMCVRVAT